MALRTVRRPPLLGVALGTVRRPTHAFRSATLSAVRRPTLTALFKSRVLHAYFLEGRRGSTHSVTLSAAPPLLGVALFVCSQFLQSDRLVSGWFLVGDLRASAGK